MGYRNKSQREFPLPTLIFNCENREP